MVLLFENGWSTIRGWKLRHENCRESCVLQPKLKNIKFRPKFNIFIPHKNENQLVCQNSLVWEAHTQVARTMVTNWVHKGVQNVSKTSLIFFSRIKISLCFSFRRHRKKYIIIIPSFFIYEYYSCPIIKINWILFTERKLKPLKKKIRSHFF